jgi:hypothetical protein
MRKIMIAGIAFSWVTAQALISSSNQAASQSLTIKKCTRSSDGALVCQPACPAQTRGGDAALEPPPGTLASLLAEGYGIIHLTVPGGGVLILRKKLSYAPTYLCDRGQLGSPADEAFTTCRYDQVPCSRAPDRY